MPLVFVYGTLKRHGSNHRFLERQRFVGQGRTEPAFRLYLLDGYPGMVATPEHGLSIEGEIWEVNAACLASLDKLEDTVSDLYARVPIRLLPPNETLAVETYLYQRDITGRLELGTQFTG
jgi:gamma-glutamylaminecyclotransferase